MAARGRFVVLTIIAIGHALLLYLLALGMRPPMPVDAPIQETVLMIEFFESPPPEPEPELEPEPDEAAPESPPPPPDTPRPWQPRAEPAPSMQVTFEEAPTTVPEPARETIAAERDPFHRPSAPATDSAFGRRDLPQAPRPNRPQIAGEAAPNAPLQRLRVNPGWSPQRIVETVGGLIGGGPNAPVEAPCGGRLSGGFGTADSFSPHWQRDHGCDPSRDPNAYDGRVELPPGSAR